MSSNCWIQESSYFLLGIPLYTSSSLHLSLANVVLRILLFFVFCSFIVLKTEDSPGTCIDLPNKMLWFLKQRAFWQSSLIGRGNCSTFGFLFIHQYHSESFWCFVTFIDIKKQANKTFLTTLLSFLHAKLLQTFIPE